MTSNFQALSRNKAHQNLIAWYHSAVLTPECLVIYGRDDNNRDLLLEVEGHPQRGLSLIEALSKNKFLQPLVVSSAQIWYYEHQRQLCASVPTSSQLGIAFRIPERTWKFDVLTTRSLASWEPKNDDEERSDFFVFRTPDPESWILKTANNGNTFSQVVFKVPTGKVSLQVWHRLAAEDVPQLASPQQFPSGTRVALTNINLRLMGHATLSMNTTCWSAFVKLEEPLLPPEVFRAEVNTLDVAPQDDGLTRGVEETAPTDTMWVVEGAELPVTQTKPKTKSTKAAQKAKVGTSFKKKLSTEVEEAKTSHDEQVEESVKSKVKSTKLKSQKSEGACHEHIKGENVTKIGKKAPEKTETNMGTPGGKETGDKKAENLSQNDPCESHSLTVGEILSVPNGNSKKKTVPSTKGTPFPDGKKGTDLIGKRVSVKGKGEGVIMGGGAVKIRIMFDVDASMKTDSLIGVDKVFLL